jgi:hypothetical protein
MRKTGLLIFFLILTPINLAISVFLLRQLDRKEKELAALDNSPRPTQTSRLYAALPATIGEVLGEATLSDARPVIISRYLEKYRSPMASHSEDLLEAADRYGVDPWLIIAIAQCESNLCKKSPPGSYNCWGFENGTTHFLSWQQAFESVAKTLKERYLDFGLDTPEEIMPKYAPPSVDKGGPWAKCVNQFIEDLESGNFE